MSWLDENPSSDVWSGVSLLGAALDPDAATRALGLALPKGQDMPAGRAGTQRAVSAAVSGR